MHKITTIVSASLFILVMIVVCSCKSSPTTSKPTDLYGPNAITIGPDGNLWFTEVWGNKIGKISPKDGKITEYNVSSATRNMNSGPIDITAGPDGNLWFTGSNKIGKISPKTGKVTEYDIPSANIGTNGIIAGPDGNLWFTDNQGNKIGKMSIKDGKVTDYSVPTADAGLNDIVVGPDGNLWFTESDYLYHSMRDLKKEVFKIA